MSISFTVIITEPTILCYEKKARFMLLFTLVIILVKFFYPICIFVLNINRHFFAFVSYILGQNLYSSLQKRNQNFVYITTICELCISLIYRWLAIRLRLIIRNGKINLRPKPPHAPLNHVFILAHVWSAIILKIDWENIKMM